jgi:hypothetical protein
LVTEDVQSVPSLLSGYEVVIAKSDRDKKENLRNFMPIIINKVREKTWKPKPLPFIDISVNVTNEDELKQTGNFTPLPLKDTRLGSRGAEEQVSLVGEELTGILHREGSKTNDFNQTKSNPRPINLTRSQQEEFKEALLHAFPIKGDLEMMVSFKLDWQLDAITGRGNYENIVFDLIRHAEAQGQITELLEAAKRTYPGNTRLQNFSFSPSTERNPRSINLTRSQLEEFKEALMDAFRSEDDLKMMLKFELDWLLDKIAGGYNSDIVFNLIKYAEARGQITELLEAAKRIKPDNPRLRNFSL